MAEKKKKKEAPARPVTIDPFYKKYCSQILKTMKSDEYYDYFMKCCNTGKNEYAFSNRQVTKEVDETWVNAVEAVIKPMGEIINNPRNFIKREEIIVNVALSKKVEAESIRHLCSHGNMIDEVTGDSVRPNRLLQITKEDSINTYENRFAYTVLEMAWDFVDLRYEAIFAAMGDEYGAHLLIKSDSYSYLENVKAFLDLKITQNEEMLGNDDNSNSIFARIARLHRDLAAFRSSSFAKQVAKFGKIKPPLVKTNAIKKNPRFKACQKLWDFILTYKDVGYKIEVREQSNEIQDEFLNDIYNSIIFNYMILKHHLEDNKDRIIDASRPIKKETVKPKYIKDIIEEPVPKGDIHYDEIKRVLIEDVTKEDLKRMDAEDRKALVEERERLERIRQREEERKQREEERIRKAEEERIEKARQKEEARLEREKRAKALEEERIAFLKAEQDKEFTEGLDTALAQFQKNREDFVKKRAAEKKAEAARLAKEEKERLAAEKKEAERIAALEKAEAERLAAEQKAIDDRNAAEIAVAEKAAEQAKLEAEKAAAIRAEAENRKSLEKLVKEKEKAEKAKLDSEKQIADTKTAIEKTISETRDAQKQAEAEIEESISLQRSLEESLSATEVDLAEKKKQAEILRQELKVAEAEKAAALKAAAEYAQGKSYKLEAPDAEKQNKKQKKADKLKAKRDQKKAQEQQMRERQMQRNAEIAEQKRREQEAIAEAAREAAQKEQKKGFFRK